MLLGCRFGLKINLLGLVVDGLTQRRHSLHGGLVHRELRRKLLLGHEVACLLKVRLLVHHVEHGLVVRLVVELLLGVCCVFRLLVK